ncbi:hypothetical protein [Robiginitalea sediminis]|uniref:hypothetical protein n=1 Tax=Robiginitalea sediminis TaxID=1982593 RepID=UPI00117AFD43|nr:hypothetical protein [Robiginitalea sediminis]
MENKYLKMAEINGMGIYSLSDLICADLPCLVENILLREWEGVIYYDERALEGHKHKEQYGNLRFWEGLKYENFKYHRKQLKRIYTDNPQCVKEIIRRKIVEKCRQLNDYTTEIDTLCIR